MLASEVQPGCLSAAIKVSCEKHPGPGLQAETGTCTSDDVLVLSDSLKEAMVRRGQSERKTPLDNSTTEMSEPNISERMEEIPN